MSQLERKKANKHFFPQKLFALEKFFESEKAGTLCVEKITLRGRLRYLILDSSADLCLVVSLLPSDCPKSGFTTLLGGK